MGSGASQPKHMHNKKAQTDDSDYQQIQPPLYLQPVQTSPKQHLQPTLKWPLPPEEELPDIQFPEDDSNRYSLMPSPRVSYSFASFFLY